MLIGWLPDVLGHYLGHYLGRYLGHYLGRYLEHYLGHYVYSLGHCVYSGEPLAPYLAGGYTIYVQCRIESLVSL